jgi:PBP1b-binding outer membrane lipoprotein LpoB
MKILLAALLLTGAVAVAQQRRVEPEQTQTVENVTPDDVITLDNGEFTKLSIPQWRIGKVTP